MSLKFSTSRSVTTKPISVGMNFPPIFCTYCRSWMVLMMAAVGGRTTDAALFQFLHQRRLVEARRRLGEVLFRAQALQRELLAFYQRGQLVLQRLIFFVLAVLRLFVDLQEAFELQDRAGDAEAIAVVARLRLGIDVDGGLIEDAWFICEATKRCQMSL